MKGIARPFFVTVTGILGTLSSTYRCSWPSLGIASHRPPFFVSTYVQGYILLREDRV